MIHRPLCPNKLGCTPEFPEFRSVHLIVTVEASPLAA